VRAGQEGRGFRLPAGLVERDAGHAATCRGVDSARAALVRSSATRGRTDAVVSMEEVCDGPNQDDALCKQCRE